MGARSELSAVPGECLCLPLKTKRLELRKLLAKVTKLASLSRILPLEQKDFPLERRDEEAPERPRPSKGVEKVEHVKVDPVVELEVVHQLQSEPIVPMV